MAYVLLLERLERQWVADRQIASAVMVAQGEFDPANLSDPREQRELFDAALVEEPRASQLDPDQVELRRALGVL